MDFLFPFGGDVGDSLLQNTDDRVAKVYLTTFIPYFDRAESLLYVRALAWYLPSRFTLISIHWYLD